MEKCIKLTPLAEIGRGVAYVTDDSIRIETEGINGGMKAWLIGKEAEPVGNLVGGKLSKKIDTTGHIGILITQSGRQVFIGKYNEESFAERKEESPFNLPGFKWEKSSSHNFEKLCKELRFIMSNRDIYSNFRKYGHYWVGEGESTAAVALKVSEDEPDPLEFLGKMKFTQSGYTIVCVDRKTKKLYIP